MTNDSAERHDVIREAAGKGAIKVIAGVYALAIGKVTLS